jgi:DNA-binding Lrp family transcriptional regulator
MTVQSFVMRDSRNRERRWTFLTNHAHTLVCIAGDPGIRIQDIAERIGITLRAAQDIVTDLVDAGYITRTRVGRRNHYEVHPELPLRHPLEHDHRVGELLEAMAILPVRPPDQGS